MEWFLCRWSVPCVDCQSPTASNNYKLLLQKSLRKRRSVVFFYLRNVSKNLAVAYKTVHEWLSFVSLLVLKPPKENYLFNQILEERSTRILSPLWMFCILSSDFDPAVSSVFPFLSYSCIANVVNKTTTTTRKWLTRCRRWKIRKFTKLKFEAFLRIILNGVIARSD